MTGRAARGLVVVLAMAGSGPIAGCGNKTPVRPPEAVQPRPATSLVARSTAGGVRLTWRRPTSYSGGGSMRDLGGFDIERAPGDGGEFARIGAMTLDDQLRFRPQRTLEWLDASAAPGASYRYRIVAFTLDGYRSVPSGSVTIRFDPSKVDPPEPR